MKIKLECGCKVNIIGLVGTEEHKNKRIEQMKKQKCQYCKLNMNKEEFKNVTKKLDDEHNKMYTEAKALGIYK